MFTEHVCGIVCALGSTVPVRSGRKGVLRFSETYFSGLAPESCQQLRGGTVSRRQRARTPLRLRAQPLYITHFSCRLKNDEDLFITHLFNHACMHAENDCILVCN